MFMINSLQNERIKNYAKLNEKKYRDGKRKNINKFNNTYNL